ncbi:MAG: FecR domain-containing protein [Bacteroidota bacterium]
MDEPLQNDDLISKWLSGDLTDEEREQLAKDDDLNDLKIVMDDLATWKLPKFDVDQGLERLKKERAEPTPKGKQIKLTNFLRIAAAIALLAISYFSWDYFLNTQIEIVTGIAETKDIELPDKSLVKLDVQSEISYDKRGWSEARNLNLSGQAFFDVQKGASFTVNTTSGSVSVLGTEFNVKVEQNTFIVQCYEGKVLVKTQQQEEVLTVGQGVSLVRGQLIRDIHDEEQPSWAQGFSEYKEALLSKVVADLTKYYKIDIALPSKYSNLKFTGKVPHSDLDSALKIIFDTMEINYSLSSDGKIAFD